MQSTKALRYLRIVVMNHQNPPGAIAEPLRDSLSRYAALVRELAGERANSLTLYGAAATPGFDPRVEPAASVIMLDRVELEMLRALAELVKITSAISNLSRRMFAWNASAKSKPC
jgi:hypothetical protein